MCVLGRRERAFSRGTRTLFPSEVGIQPNHFLALLAEFRLEVDGLALQFMHAFRRLRLIFLPIC